MRLHANAALSLNQRRRLVERVVAQGWSLTKAAEAAEVSDRTAAKWVARYRAEGEVGLLDRSSAPAVVANRTDERRIEAIAALRRLRFSAPELAELLDMPLSTVSGILTRIGMGRLGRLGLERAQRYERQRPGELIHIDVKKLGRIERGAGKRIFGGSSHYTGSFTDAAGTRRRRAGWDYVHIAIDDATRLALCRSPQRRESDDRGRVPAPRAGVLRPPRRDRRTRAHRQRLALHRHAARRCLPHPEDPPPAHPPAAPADQRQGRTLHPHHARRVGLRRHLRLKHRTHRSP
jgi:transposase